MREVLLHIPSGTLRLGARTFLIIFFKIFYSLDNACTNHDIKGKIENFLIKQYFEGDPLNQRILTLVENWYGGHFDTFKIDTRVNIQH